MDLTQYKLEELIKNSKKKINVPFILYKNLKLFTIILVIEALVLCPFTWNFINPSIYLWIVAVFAPIKTGLNLILPRLQKKRANQKLEEVVQILKQNGIHTCKMNLKQAKVASRYLKCIINDNGAMMTSKHVVMFQDRTNQLKALKQARAEFQALSFPFKNTIVGETQIIKEEEKAKQLYLAMKKR